MKLLFTADWHIKLKDKLPIDWVKSRYFTLVDIINQEKVDLVIIGGDIFDVPKPSVEEIELYHNLMMQLNHHVRVYSGNHEARTKTHSCLYNLSDVTRVAGGNRAYVMRTGSYGDFDIVDYIDLKSPEKYPNKNRLCLTHVRGEIPPHVTWEVDPEYFKHYELVLAGDLHSHKNSQGKFIYPGSPFSVTFHKELTKGTWGYIIIDSETLEWKFIDLVDKIPQLYRKTISDPKDAKPDNWHHVEYIIEGDITEVAKIDNPLITKKVNLGINKAAVLDLEDMDESAQMRMFLISIMGLAEDKVKVLVDKYTKAVLEAKHDNS